MGLVTGVGSVLEKIYFEKMYHKKNIWRLTDFSNAVVSQDRAVHVLHGLKGSQAILFNAGVIFSTTFRFFLQHFNFFNFLLWV